MIVMKFGGTSTQDAAAMTNVARIVRAHLPKQPVVVISAIAGATNALEKIGALATEQREQEALEVIDTLIGRHRAIIDELIRHPGRRQELTDMLSKAAEHLRELTRGVSILQELTPRTLDAFYAHGELLSSRLVAAVLAEQGIEAAWLDTKDFMVTDDHHNRAMPRMETVEACLQALAAPVLSRGTVIVTQGYIGVTTSGRRTTMGRESSDYSAAVIGAALHADDIQIWTDVDGILTGDPRVVEAPMKVKQLSFEEAYELSFFGAKVLHPNTMLPAIERNIPIHIFNSRHPERSGTRVTMSDAQGLPSVKSVASKNDMVLLTVRPKKRYGAFSFWEHLFNILTNYSAVPALAVSSESSIAFALDRKVNVGAIVHDMGDLGHVDLTVNLGILCVVGSQLHRSPALLNRILQAVGSPSPAMVSFGASRSSVSLLLDGGEVTGAVQRVHAEFFGTHADDDMFERLNTRQASLRTA